MQRSILFSFFTPFLLSPFLSGTALAQLDSVAESSDENNIEVVVVTGVRSGEYLQLEVAEVTHQGVDNSDLLRLFPGGNRNSNGQMTRISQYRGLYGAQNNVSIDGQAYTSGGPNWMDSPLSSIPQSLTQSVTLYRGLGSVATIKEGLGGGVDISARRAGFADQDGWNGFGQAEAAYGTNADSLSASLYAGAHSMDNWFDLAVSTDKGDDYKFDGGTVATTEYERQQYRLGYGHQFSRAELVVAAVINRTGDSGTPALPMDIRYVDSEQYSLELDTSAAGGEFNFGANVLSVEHVMDNFALRPARVGMGGMKMLRQTYAEGDSGGFNLTFDRITDNGDWLFGVDAKLESHNADVTNPSNPMFFITNFNDAKRDRVGVFAQLTRSLNDWDIEAGIRYNHVKMDTDDVGGNLAMMNAEMMAMSQQDRLDILAKQFNEADRNKKDNQWSGIFRASRDLTDTTRLNLGVGRKVRSPSYQERYLWLPMEATAGLADGFTYIGDINLKPETSFEVTAGIDWSIGRLKFTPELYFRDVNNYIQGVPSTNMVANMFAMMMSGKPPLQFANVDAELYGFDLGYELEISDSWLLRGNLGYVRGKRTDVKDNLYRIAPLSSFLELMYINEKYFVALESIAAAKQDKVSAYNTEQKSSGWGIASLRFGIELNSAFDLSLGVENVFDKAYQDHLGGYNRVADSDVALGERLYGTGRNFYLKLNASW